MPCRGPAHLARLPLGVEPGGDAGGLRVQLDDGVQRRPLPVERVDPPTVFLDERSRGLLARLHLLLQVGERRLLEVGRAPWNLRTARDAAWRRPRRC